MKSFALLRGFSLIEVMVALAISALLLVGLVTTFTNANTTYAELTKTSRQIENGRYALSLLENEIQHAGLYGEYTGTLAVRDPANPPVLNAPLPCADGPVQFRANLMVPIFGYDGGAAAPANVGCIPNYQPNTDILVLRRTSTEIAPLPLDAASVYFQGFLDAPPASRGPFLDFGSGTFTATYPKNGNPVPIHRFLQRIYYIASCSRCDLNDNIPTLSRLEFQSPGVFTIEPLVEGVQDMRIRYGVDLSGLNNGSPSVYKKASAMVMDPDWDSVVAVEINLLARNTQESRGYTDTKTYDLVTATVGPFNDSVRRHVFSQTIRAINLATRREE